MTPQEKLDRLEQKLELVLDAMEQDTTLGDMIYHSTLFEVYMDRREELKKQLQE